MSTIEFINELSHLIEEYLTSTIESNPAPIQMNNEPIIMLTIKECCMEFSGLTENTVRQLVKQGKISYIRTGEGNHGKILINKAALAAYLNGAA